MLYICCSFFTAFEGDKLNAFRHQNSLQQWLFSNKSDVTKMRSQSRFKFLTLWRWQLRIFMRLFPTQSSRLMFLIIIESEMFASTGLSVQGDFKISVHHVYDIRTGLGFNRIKIDQWLRTTDIANYFTWNSFNLLF